MPTRRTTISRAAATRRSIARCWGSTEKITEKITDKRGEGRMTTTLHKGRLFWLGVLALFAAAASLAIRGAKIGRTAGRARVCQYVLVSVVAVTFKTTNRNKFIKTTRHNKQTD